MVGGDSHVAVYILASGRNGTLYTGVTSALAARVRQHKLGVFEGFSSRHGCKRLVWYEDQPSMATPSCARSGSSVGAEPGSSS